MSVHYDVLIIGAGHAGAHAASTLRDKGFGGSILIIGDEPVLPYDRPSLSKAYMLGSITIEKILLRDDSYWRDRNVDLLLGSMVARLDAKLSMVTLSDGRDISFGHCILATGGMVRRLTCPGAQLPNIFSVRSVADVDAIRAMLKPEMKVVIVGGGYVGLEAAAVLRELGHGVTLIEAQDRLLARVAGPALSHFVEHKHKAHGVNILLNQQVAAIEGTDQVTGVILATGMRLPADLVIVGIGITPQTALAEQAGIDCDAGILVDTHGRTSAQNIYAIGDCARHPNIFAGGLWRLESVQHATASAEIVADAILGTPRPYEALPTFWSDQYDMRIQSAGILQGPAEVVTRGDASTGSFSLFYLQDGAVVALDAINAPKDFMGGRALVQKRLRVDPAALANLSVPVRQIAAGS